jgi:uncharacterized protein (TIGR00369 family)
MDAKAVKYSETTITELMIPAYANFGGKIHGGILLSIMDKVAYACSSKHAGNYCVTVAVENVDFHQPVEVGDLISFHASVNYVGRSSLVIGIKVVAENVKLGTVRHTNSSYFTMVAKGDDNKPTMVPELILENDTQVRRFLETLKRKELSKVFKNKLKEAKSSISRSDVTLLEKERCFMGFE